MMWQMRFSGSGVGSAAAAVLALAAVAHGQVVEDFETGGVGPEFVHACDLNCCGGPGVCQITNTLFDVFPLPSYMLFMDGASNVVTWTVPEPILAASVDVLDFGGGFNPTAGTTSIDFIGINGTRRFGNDIIVANEMVNVYADQDTLDDTGTTGIGQILQIEIQVGLQGAYDNITLYTQIPAPPSCICNIDENPRAIDVFDLLAYLDLWFAGDAAAELDGQDGINVFDLLTFLDCWFSPDGVPGC
jgi:hypothetical protein